jgi:threonine/homoserine/homoserine lactone efflux protein
MTLPMASCLVGIDQQRCQQRGSIMDQAPQLWLWWLSLLSAFVPGFTRPGWVRFVQWVTGMVLCWEEHTLTQILTALGLESRWRVLERFAA